MEFTPFCHALIRVPCQILQTGRQIVYRLLSGNPWQPAFLRLVETVRQPTAIIEVPCWCTGRGLTGEMPEKYFSKTRRFRVKILSFWPV